VWDAREGLAARASTGIVVLLRRTFVKSAATALATAALPSLPTLPILAYPGSAQAWELESVGGAVRFDYAWLKGRARALAAKPHVQSASKIPPSVANLSYDQYQAIRFRKEHALWAKGNSRFRAQFFHLGMYFKWPVRLFELEGGRARQIAYGREVFQYGKSGLGNKSLPADLGFAGFQLFFQTDWTRDVAAFLGASYFRAVGGSWQYGLSARGLAVDCGLGRPEEFPMFTAFWLERPADHGGTAVVYALLESESITGAYRFAITPGASMLMDVDAALYPRKAIERLGIAPCTSMFQCAENDQRMGHDFRPEIHDSDGLAMCTGSGEWIWRPLTNPRQVRFNAYADRSPRGFGLLQRDRNFEHYQDDAVFYERRPSLWVEPKSDWGEGSVQLVELPTVDETLDNIVAFWNPKQPCKPGEERLFSYRLHWGAQCPVSPQLAQVSATRTGLGGVVGQKRKFYSYRFAIDFAGGDLWMLGKDTPVEPVITSSRGEILIPSARPLHSIQGYRAIFDIRPTDDSVAPINLRLYLKSRGRPLSETWAYQWTPPPASERILL
jgi:periplasmic glucans biosynthesis protein